MIHLLLDLLEALDSCTLESFLGRVRMVFNVIIPYPLGYCIQNDVLGCPNTGGQILHDDLHFGSTESLGGRDV